MAAAAKLRISTTAPGGAATRTLLWMVLIASAACGREERTQTAFTPALERASVIGDSMSLLAPVVGQLPDTMAADTPAAELSLTLEGLGEASLYGAVMLSHAGSATRVVAVLGGGAAARTYGGMIRRGTCAQIGSRVAALVPATADSAGTARSLTDASLPLRSLRAAPHVIVFGENNRPQTCGAI